MPGTSCGTLPLSLSSSSRVGRSETNLGSATAIYLPLPAYGKNPPRDACNAHAKQNHQTIKPQSISISLKKHNTTRNNNKYKSPLPNLTFNICPLKRRDIYTVYAVRGWGEGYSLTLLACFSVHGYTPALCLRSCPPAPWLAAAPWLPSCYA